MTAAVRRVGESNFERPAAGTRAVGSEELGGGDGGEQGEGDGAAGQARRQCHPRRSDGRGLRVGQTATPLRNRKGEQDCL